VESEVAVAMAVGGVALRSTKLETGTVFDAE
jgi:hypothetical protein